MNGLKTLAVCVAVVAAATAAGQNTTRAEYIERYRETAVAHAEKYGIPASIKMAQGILESGYGNSALARTGNTHFNIKVKAADKWQGPVVYADDDRPNEPFRAYDTAEESWIDHSEYLDKQPRYDSLFRYGTTDYKAWARGLKNCGYATDPMYAEKLVRVIEENELWRLDTPGDGGRGETVVLAVTDAWASGGGAATAAGTDGLNVDGFLVAIHSAGGRAIVRNADGLFVVAHKGDTLPWIAELTGVRVRRLARLNGVAATAALDAGQMVKIEKK